MEILIIKFSLLWLKPTCGDKNFLKGQSDATFSSEMKY